MSDDCLAFCDQVTISTRKSGKAFSERADTAPHKPGELAFVDPTKPVWIPLVRAFLHQPADERCVLFDQYRSIVAASQPHSSPAEMVPAARVMRAPDARAAGKYAAATSSIETP